MSLREALPWILAYGMGGLLWLSLREYARTCREHVEALREVNRALWLALEIVQTEKGEQARPATVTEGEG